jgi:hypothetical protein
VNYEKKFIPFLKDIIYLGNIVIYVISNRPHTLFLFLFLIIKKLIYAHLLFKLYFLYLNFYKKSTFNLLLSA